MDASATPVTQPLSSAQTEVWLAQQLHPDSPVYNIAQYTVIDGVIDAAVFEAALRQVIDEADTLRLQFVDSDDGLRQRIGAPAWSMPVLDLTSQADPQAAADAWMRADYQQPVNLMQGPLFCYALLKVAPAQWIWYQRYHHIMTDGYGQYLIAQRVARVYSALCAGTAPAACDFGSIRQLLESDAQYQASTQRAQDEAYWLKHCAHWPEPATLASRAAPALQQRLRQTAYLATQLMEDYVLDAGRLAQFLSAALAAYLHRMTGAQDVLFGFPVTARLGADWHIPGMVANTVPLRFRFEPEINLVSLMRQAAKEIQSALHYQRYPSEALQRQLGLAPGQLLFGIKVNVMPFDYELSFGEHSSTNHNLLAGPVDDLMLGVYWTPNSRQLRIDFDANPACYTAEMLDAHQRRFIRFVQALAADATHPISGIDLLDADERHRLLVEWNATQQAYPAHLCVHQLFEAQVKRTPEAPALVFEDQTFSYTQLNAQANRLAHQLLEWGVKPDARVAICVQRSPAMVVGLLAILKAGGAYVPLDPAYPSERLTHILADAAPAIVLADATGRAALGDAALAERTVLDPATLPALPDTNPSIAELTARHLAYVIYTSGSTGTPKGVKVEHAQVVRLFEATQPWYGFNEHDTWCLFHSFAFDFSVWELWGALRYGGKLVIVPHSIARSADAFYQLICEQGVTVLNQTPSAFKALMASQTHRTLSDQLRYVILGGEALEPAILQAWYATHDERHPQLVNMYGITEATVHVTYRPLRQQDSEQAGSPVGTRIPDLTIYLLDAHGQPVPLGAVGELYIGGAGVARGYLNRPELTAERFVRDPFVDESDARMYKTGDLARYLPDGNLEFVGRNDEQVKIRGFRIEPGEIAACLTAHPQVRDAVVLATGEGSAKRLVAYVVAKANDALAGTLRTHVAATLPEYMVPSAFVRLDAWPLTPNGKLDRRALPAPDDDALAHQAYELYIGGAGVARGYLNRPALTAERFVPDPFSIEPDARLYKTGDLARYLPDGNLEFLGRNDEQVKIRGFRIEPGEIEACLTAHPQVRDAVVLATGEGSAKRLVAYVQAEADEQLASTLRAQVAAALPEYMVPSAFVRLDAWPLTPNGKLDRRALPAPDDEALAHQAYEAPKGELETTLAAIWAELLDVERVGRHDSFFALGGHSLLAVQLIERLRRRGLSVSVRLLFEAPTLSALAQTLGQHRDVVVPANVITPDTTAITPSMLPLIELTQADIDKIVEQVPDGVANIQDIYALSSLQDGLLFHHLLARDGDPYLLIVQLAFDTRARLDQYLHALQQVIDRHDILRTAFVWEGVSTPAQVVWCHARLPVTELTLDAADGPIAEQLTRRFDPRHTRLDLTQAPLLHCAIAQDTEGRWLLMQRMHHLIDDNTTLRMVQNKVRVVLEGRGDTLPPAQPFRHLVAQARLGVSEAEHERFFTEQLADIDEPTLPFGLAQVQGDGSDVSESHRMLPPVLNDQLRVQAKRLGVSLASLCHLAWAQVLARVSGQQRVVFGTVLFGRMQAGEGADRAMGLFINTLPLRVDLDGSVQACVRGTHARLAALLEHEHASLALAQRCSGVPAGTPLFSALLNYRHNATDSSERSGLPGVELLSAQERTNYPIGLSVDDDGQSLGLTAQSVPSLEPERVCAYMQQALHSLADALEATPGIAVQQLQVLPEAERELLLQTWNATQRDYPSHVCVHQLFEAQVERTPEATALVFETQTLSYAQLNAQANRLAHQLIEWGVRPDARVAICVQRSPALVVGLLAILKAGGAYVPLDPAYPGERLTHILTDAAPNIVLADAAGRAALGDAALAQCTVLDPAILPALPATNPSVAELTARHLAYVIYTSGSTGMPKGVQNEHQALVNRLVWMQQAYGLTTADRVLQKTPVSFDVSVWELFWTLLNGATLVVAAPDVHKDPAALIELITRQRITTAHFVPSMLSLFLHNEGAQHCTSVKRLICSGEALPGASVRLCQTLLPGAQLYNLYGPTEAAIDVTAWTCPANYTEDTVPIGRPIANTRIYLLDSHGQPVPLGAVGELYIGGAGVARGYLNRPELTAERFVPDPFSIEPDARLYKTGDVARYLSDGNLEFLGRNDEQVKIRGFRIEPGEIAACLTAHPQVRDAVVLALGEGQDKRLVAYVQAEADEPLASTLRTQVAARLPEYMVPSAFVRLDAWPLTPNGKLDRRALPAPDDAALAHQAYEAPQGELETTLATIWAELLGVERVGRHDSFFALGGHSLLAVQLIERLRRRGIGLSVRALFDTPVLSALAQTLGQHRDVVVPANAITPDTTAITPSMLPLIELTQADIDKIVEQVPQGVANIQDIYALSPLQNGLLFHHLLARDGDPYLLIVQLAFDTRARLDQYLHALQQVIDRHDILRTAFVWEGVSTPAQVVWRHALLPVTELTLDAADGPIAEQLAQRFDPRHTRLDLTQAPLLHCAIAQDRRGRWLLMQRLHHLIGDHSTLEVMHVEVGAFIEGRGDTLPPAQPFRHLVAQARLGVSQAEHERFFTEQLVDIDEPTLPFGLTQVQHDGSDVSESHRMLPSALNDRLRAHAKRLGVSLASLCHLAWAQVLARASGQPRVVFGTVLFGRMQAGEGADRAMGLFINTLPLRVDLDGSVQDSVHETHARLAALLEHEHASLALAQRCSGVPAGTPLFSALLNYRHNAMDSSERSGLPGVELLSAQERTNYPLTLSVEDFGQALGLTAQSVRSLEPERVCAYMQQALHSLADALEATPGIAVQQLQVLPEAERQLLLDTWNATQRDYPSHLCIHQLFEAQVERTPEAPALVFEDQTLSYAQLNAQANRLAHQLIELGVKPDARVAICVQRSPTLIVGLLAILKAGGAYVPLDPAYPSERLVHILTDAAPKIVLADAAGRAALGEAALASCTVLDPATVPALPDTNPSVAALTARHLAYVIYTSGSTGTPKGVMVEHRNVANLCTWHNRTFGVQSGCRSALTAGMAFDASAWELWPSLIGGGMLFIPSQAVCEQVPALLHWWQQQPLEVAFLVTPLAEMALADQGTPAGLRYLLTGGECFPGVRQALPAGLTLANQYGPTEATVVATSGQLSAEDTLPHIGRPIANTRVYLLDAHGQPAPLGAVGELYIGGAGVARGYLNRPELTAERFVPDPFSDDADARLYKTGGFSALFTGRQPGILGAQR
ncbi:amino acid adenylation domain-containing protein [Mycetohabitans endofungorum]|uniref:amino acid adenylation domain-containing protein n=1 Tax=Mycetohabitans endofungorum TaxID=417203 RepID=UPI003BAF2A29